MRNYEKVKELFYPYPLSGSTLCKIQQSEKSYLFDRATGRLALVYWYNLPINLHHTPDLLYMFMFMELLIKNDCFYFSCEKCTTKNSLSLKINN